MVGRVKARVKCFGASVLFIPVWAYPFCRVYLSARVSILLLDAKS